MLPIGRTPGSFSDNERVLVSVQFLNWGELQALSPNTHIQVLTNGHAEHYVDYISFRKTSSNNKNIKQSSIKKKKKNRILEQSETESAPLGKGSICDSYLYAVFVSILYSLSTWKSTWASSILLEKRRWSTPGATSKHSGEDRSFNYIINFQDIRITFETAEHKLLEEAQLQVPVTENTEDLIHQPPLFPLISSFQRAAVSPSCRVAGPPSGGVIVEAKREARGGRFCCGQRLMSSARWWACVCVCVCVCGAPSYLTLCNSMDCTPPGFSVHGILQARILEWVPIPFSRGSSRPRDRIQVSWLAGEFFTTEPPRKPCWVHRHLITLYSFS